MLLQTTCTIFYASSPYLSSNLHKFVATFGNNLLAFACQLAKTLHNV